MFLDEENKYFFLFFADSSLPVLPYTETEATDSPSGMLPDYSGWCLQ